MYFIAYVLYFMSLKEKSQIIPLTCSSRWHEQVMLEWISVACNRTIITNLYNK